MQRLILLLISIASFSSYADNSIFKTCAERDFCKNLRKAAPGSYEVNISSSQIKDNTVYLPLKLDDLTLTLQVSLLTDPIVRIKILEDDSTRYQLKDVLDQEPSQLEINTVKLNDDKIEINPKNNAYNYHSVVITRGPPFKIEFRYDTKVKVAFGDRFFMAQANDDNQSFAFDVGFEDATKLYGLHHHAYDLELGETSGDKEPYRLRNSDTAHYSVDSPVALYGSVPAIYGHSKSSTSGIFLHNAAEQWIDIKYGDKPSAYFMVESAALDLFVLLGPTPKEVVRQFTTLTGVAHLPQLWTLGYHQCRWSYLTQEDVQEVASSMKSNDFPLDAIWLDIDYTDGKKYFTWNDTSFSNPDKLQEELAKQNVKLVTILDPHIKVDDAYDVYTQAKKKYFVQNANETDFEGDCWPGKSSYLDFLNPEARDYYAGWYSYDKFPHSKGVAGVWNDMNEPSVFDDSLEKTLPFDTVHHGNVKHRDVHNIYGFLHTKATHDGLMKRDNSTKRPFILTRSHFAGSQRYAAMWTGDNTADWPYLRTSYSECLLSNLMGHVFCGADVGGFFDEPSEELAQRWWQAGVWLPFYRGHATNDTHQREPYTFSTDAQKVIRNAIKLRYKHIPVWYTLFFEHTSTGDPVIKPLFYNYPGTVSRNDHLLLGDDILARPVLEEGVDKVEVYFPGDSKTLWYRVDDDSWRVYAGGSAQNLTVDISTSPFFYRGGSIIVRRDHERPTTTDSIKDSFTLYINLDADNNADGRIYVDDYESFDYSKKQAYFYASLSYLPNSHGIHVSVIDGNPEGFEVFVEKIVIHNNTGKQTTPNSQLFHKIDLGKTLSNSENKKFAIHL